MAPSYKIWAVIAVLLLPSTVLVTSADDLTDQLERQIPEWMERFAVPGASVVLIRDARIVWAKGFGKAVAGKLAPMRIETVCLVGPISQSLTAWGVMSLAEENRIDLKAPIGRYLSRWQLPSSPYDHSKVSIERLLSHNAGILSQDYPVHEDASSLPSLKETLSGVIYDLPPARVIHEPGARFLYSEPGYSLLELLIEEVSGTAFDEYMRQTVFEPLNMRRSFFARYPLAIEQIAAAHNRRGDALPRAYPSQLAAAGLHTSAGDLARFVIAGLPSLRGAVHGYPVLRQSTIQSMQQPVVNIPTKFQLGAEAYGLGYLIEETDKGVVLISNGGFAAPGWFAQFYGVPQTGDGLVILTNSRNGRPLINAVTQAWAAHCRIGRPQLIVSLRKMQRLAWGITVGGSLLSLLLLILLIRALVQRKITVARQYRLLRLAGLLLISLVLFSGWTTLQQLVMEWLPELSPWPNIALAILGGTAALWLLIGKK